MTYEYRCQEGNLRGVLQSFQVTFPESIMANTPLDELVSTYQELFPAKDGYHPFSAKRVIAVGRQIVDKATLELVNKGFANLHWDDETNDFAISLTDKGKAVAEHKRRNRGT